ncbi:hypothetical protein PC116_g31424 [Phytophthora cactorum]|nr:hypothetical protein PC116_g31424 [Phytophthora cactorum]
MSTPLHFRREDEGGAAHVMSNGTQNIGPNGFGRPRRQVPGAEFLESGSRTVPGAAPAEVPGANGDENLSKAALKNKKKRNNKKAKDPENKDGERKENGGLAPPPRDQGPGSGNEGRSPERRGQHFNQRRHDRSRSRHNFQGGNTNQGRNRSNTHQNGQAAPTTSQIQTSQPPAGDALLSPGSQNPASKKLRSLQKKIRAIEDLEMRHAGGEKLEDTQMKKIATKAAVVKELEALEKEAR